MNMYCGLPAPSYYAPPAPSQLQGISSPYTFASFQNYHILQEVKHSYLKDFGRLALSGIIALVFSLIASLEIDMFYFWVLTNNTAGSLFMPYVSLPVMPVSGLYNIPVCLPLEEWRSELPYSHVAESMPVGAWGKWFTSSRREKQEQGTFATQNFPV